MAWISVVFQSTQGIENPHCGLDFNCFAVPLTILPVHNVLFRRTIRSNHQLPRCYPTSPFRSITN